MLACEPPSFGLLPQECQSESLTLWPAAAAGFVAAGWGTSVGTRAGVGVTVGGAAAPPQAASTAAPAAPRAETRRNRRRLARMARPPLPLVTVTGSSHRPPSSLRRLLAWPEVSPI